MASASMLLALGLQSVGGFGESEKVGRESGERAGRGLRRAENCKAEERDQGYFQNKLLAS